MTVTIDPSEVRNQASVKRSFAVPNRAILLAGLGSVGLIAFTYGAFSFFSGLADPRARPARPAVAAASLPDLKDGLPVLVSENGATKATVLNLPKPPVSETESQKLAIGVRTEPLPSTEAPLRTASADATGSVSQRAATQTKAAKATPSIENAPTVSGDPKPVALVAPARLTGPLAPAKTETVRAKAVEPGAVASLSPEPAKPDISNPTSAQKRAAAAPKPAKVKTVQAQAPSRVVEASAAPAPVAAGAGEEESEGLSSKLQSGIKAIGSLFGDE